MKSVPENETII